MVTHLGRNGGLWAQGGSLVPRPVALGAGSVPSSHRLTILLTDERDTVPLLQPSPLPVISPSLLPAPLFLFFPPASAQIRSEGDTKPACTFGLVVRAWPTGLLCPPLAFGHLPISCGMLFQGRCGGAALIPGP